jgi:hypothetical protein
MISVLQIERYSSIDKVKEAYVNLETKWYLILILILIICLFEFGH